MPDPHLMCARREHVETLLRSNSVGNGGNRAPSRAVPVTPTSRFLTDQPNGPPALKPRRLGGHPGCIETGLMTGMESSDAPPDAVDGQELKQHLSQQDHRIAGSGWTTDGLSRFSTQKAPARLFLALGEAATFLTAQHHNPKLLRHVLRNHAEHPIVSATGIRRGNVVDDRAP